MITAHLPAGYVFTSLLRRRWPEVPLWVGLAGSIFPDLDLLYFYLVDHRRTLHHRYWTHLPLVWLAIGCVLIGGAHLLKAERAKQWAAVFVLNVLLHQSLDTIVGKILWLAPFDTRAIYLFTVPAAHGHWLLNFLLHWSIVFEFAIWVVAVTLWLRARPRSTMAIPFAQRPASALPSPPEG